MRLWNSQPDKPSVTTAEVVAIDHDDAMREAYARGRRDERARRRRSPALALAVALTAIVGSWTLVSAALRGSFEGGGQMIDTQLVTAGQEAGPALRQAAQGAAQRARGDKVQGGVTQE